MSPSSYIVGPSSVTSNGTETTEIEDEAAENAEEENGQVRHSVRGFWPQQKTVFVWLANRFPAYDAQDEHPGSHSEAPERRGTPEFPKLGIFNDLSYPM